MNKRLSFGNEKTIRLIMLLVAIALSVKYIFVDFGIDAEFQISMSYRLAKGDIMFKEMWEPYQMSAFLCAFFIKIYLAIFHTSTGIVLYLQIIGVLLDGMVSCFIFSMVKKYLKCNHVAFAMAWVFFVVSPKDVPLPEYANMQIWFSMLLCITLFLYHKTQRRRYLILSALSLCGAVLSYPSCLILFLGVMFLLLYRKDKSGSIIFGSTCLIAGGLYLYLIFQKVSFDEFVIFIENMLSLETSHSIGIFEKCMVYLKEALSIAIIFCVAYGVAYVIIRALKRKINSIQEKEIGTLLTDALFYGIVLFISLYTIIFWKENVRYSYSLVFLSVILIGMHYRKSLSPDKYFLYLCGTLLSILQFVATLLLTNLEFMASVPYLIIAVIAAFLPISEEMKKLRATKSLNRWKTVILLCGVLFLVFRNSYMIRPMSGDVASILDIGGIVKKGPAVGIVSEYMGAYMQNESMKEWEQYIADGDAIFLIGGALDTLGYLYSDTIIAAPSLVPTPGYNESVLEYWKINPDKYPDVIIASCWYGTMKVDNSWMTKWIEEEFKPQYQVDGKYWRYYFK